MKRTSFMRIMSFILAMVLVFQMSPLQVFAADTEQTSTSDDAIVYNGEELVGVDTADPEVYIEGEVNELRTEYEKHYRLTDGSFMVVQYQVPVHYQDNGEWEDIDNTLQSVSMFNGSQQYQNANGDSIQAFASDLSSGTVMTMAKGDYTITMSIVTEDTASVAAPASVNAELESVTVSEESGVVSAATAQIITESDVTDAEGTAEETLPRTLDDVIPETLSSSILYENVFPGVDLRYDTYSYNVKESIILKEQMDQEEYAYSFQLDLSGLTPELQEDGSILLLNESEETEYTIPAPYMWDSNNSYSEAVCYTLEENTDGWLMTVHADAEWLEDNDRVYPVTIDPSYIISGSKLKFATAVEKGTPSSTTTVARKGELSCGYSQTYGNLEGYVKVTALPSLPIGSTIVEAKLYPISQSTWLNSSCRMDISMMTEALTATQWAGFVPWSQRPDSVSPAMDFIFASSTASDAINPNEWDLTEAMMQWYEDPNTNYGLRITGATNAASTTGSSWVRFAPAESWLTIRYRNDVGTESYYTYETQSAVRAGTGYVGDFSSALTVFKSDVSFSSTTLPFTLSHVFNSVLREKELSSYDSAVTFAPDYSKMKTGYGWQLSVQESVLQTTINGSNYQVYRDGDGTLHYFVWDSGSKYYDEDGLGYTLTQYSGGIESSYSLKDQQGNLKFFWHNLLAYIEDANENRICLLYNNKEYVQGSSSWYPTGSGDKLTKIVAVNKDQAATTICTLTYNSSNQLTTITDNAGRVTTFTYSNGRLVKVTQPDGAAAHYAYNSAGQLIRMFDDEADYGIEYGYDGDKVVKIHEYTASAIGGSQTVGVQVEREKLGLQKAVYRYDGNDRTFGTEDDIVNHYSFDYSGRTINAITLDSDEKEILGVTAAAYTESSSDTPAANNKIEKTAQSGQNGVNLLSAGGAETHDGFTPSSSNWAATSSASGYTAAINGTKVRNGSYALKTAISTSAADNVGSNKRAAIYQTVTLEAGKTYTFSAYVNTESISSFEESGGVYVAFMNTANTILASGDKITFTTDADIDSGWQRIYATYKCTTKGTYRVAAVQENAVGTAYFDDLQLEVGSVPSNVNLIQNGTFNVATEWTLSDFDKRTTAGSSTMDALHPNVLATDGDPEDYLRASQRIHINKTCTDTTFLLSGWGKAASAADAVENFDWQYGSSITNEHEERYFGLIARCWYTNADGDAYCDYHYMPFNDNYDDWQFASCVIVPDKYYQTSEMTLKYIDVYVVYDNNFNTMYVDNISLRQEPCTTYTYDSTGSVTAVNSTGKSSESVSYVSGTTKPSTVRTAGSGVYIYQYKDENNTYLPSYISNYSTEAYTYYKYDKFGNNTQTHIGNLDTEGTKEIESYATYSADGSQLLSETNGNGQTTTYTYDTNRDLIKTTDANGTVVLTEEDEKNDRPTSSSISGTVSVNYSYSNGLLSRITRSGYISGNTTAQNQYYNMSYDSFGNMTQVSIGEDTNTDRVLASYDYGNRNNHLDSMTYGNGDRITYTYDELDRVIMETWSDGTSYEYIYNSEGALSKKVDSTADRAVNYEYDSLGRLIHSSATDADGIAMLTEHLYDRANRIKQQSWQLRNSNGSYKTYSESYTYRSSDGAITAMTPAIGNVVSFTYDTLARLTGQSNDIYSRTYTYRNISSTRTTSQIQKISYAADGTSFVPFSLSYTYDKLGNIASVSSSEISSQNASYVYDVQGQLTSETLNGTQYKYVYDTYGNIRSVSQVVDGTTTNLHTYAYTDADWKDLLTEFDGEDISYDTIGNPTSYYNGTRWAFNWAHGRQLTSAAATGYTIGYTYDLAGIRNSKTVNNVTYNYLTLSGKVMRQTWGGNTIDFAYDNAGNPYAFTYNGTTYYYVLNQQGDVIRIVGTDGKTKAEYVYNAWGKLMVDEDDLTTIGQINPIRYRGYYYDTETGFYYLQSRYYDPEIGRFINADAVTFIGANSTFNSYNLFAYCLNNPVNNTDDGGTFSLPNWAKVAIGAVATVAAVAVTVATGGAAAPVLVTVATSTVINGAIGYANGGVEGMKDGLANGFMMGGLSALGGSIIGGAVRTIKNAKAGITIGKMGTFEDVAKLAKTRRYTGLKEYKFIKTVFGKKAAETVGWWQNKCVVKGVMALKGAIYDCGGELTGAYAKEVVLTKGYEYLYNIWVL